MSEVDRIKSLVKEADFYRSQGLLEQAKYRYSQALHIVQKSDSLKNKEALADSLKNRIKYVDDSLEEVDKETEPPELTEDVQKLISNLFSFSMDKDVGAIEGAVALAKFGQYEKAFTEFQRLIDERVLPVMAAQNMLRCQMLFISFERAIDQYKMWTSSPIFTKNELMSIRRFMENIFKKEGVELELPEVQITLQEEKAKKDLKAEPVLEISSISFPIKNAFGRQMNVELEITFQTGNILSFIIKEDKRDIIDFLNPGVQIPVVQCFSSLSIFQAKGFVSDKKLIPSGPRKGDYTFDLTIEKA